MGHGGMLTLDQLRTLVEDGKIDTVLVAMTDMQGRLQGKRCAADYFLNEVVPHATEACDYLLAVDVEMNTVGGYAMSSCPHGTVATATSFCDRTSTLCD
jgi:glutamine synthetase